MAAQGRAKVRVIRRQACIEFCCGAIFLLGCKARSPFEYTNITGKVCYEDGSLLPVAQLVLNFHPQAGPVNGKDFARTGSALVDSKTGEFDRVVSVKGKSGLVTGRHKVTLHLPNRQPLPLHVASPDYGDPDRTSLEIDTSEGYLFIRIKRPE